MSTLHSVCCSMFWLCYCTDISKKLCCFSFHCGVKCHFLITVCRSLDDLLYEPPHQKTGFCLCENKGADQLSSNCTADQCLYFCYKDSTIPTLLKSKISIFKTFSVAAQAGLCWTWSETPMTGFLASQLILYMVTKR